MPKGYRRHIIAVIGCLALTGASPPRHHHKDTNAEGQTPQAPSVSVRNPSSDYSAYPDKYSDKCYEAKDHDAADLCGVWRATIATEKAADAAWWATVISVVGMVLSAFGLGALLYTLRQSERALEQARKSNEIAMANGELQVQAYISLVDTLITINNHEIFVRAVFKNTGQSPAMSFRYGIFAKVETTTETMSNLTIDYDLQRPEPKSPLRIVGAGDVIPTIYTSVGFTPKEAGHVIISVSIPIQYRSVFGNTITNYWQGTAFYSSSPMGPQGLEFAPESQIPIMVDFPDAEIGADTKHYYGGPQRES